MEEKYWKQFENSGRIEDYLSFVSSSRQNMRGMDSKEEMLSAKGTCLPEDEPSGNESVF